MRLAAGLGLAVAAAVLAPLAAVALRAEALAPGPADGAALRFTLVQAGLSAVIAGVLAVPLARALGRRRFAGRGALVALMSAPFVLPVVVAVLGFLAVFGRAGPVNAALAALGLPAFSIYGLHGVVMANVFFNLPLATRMLMLGWQAIPAERFRLAASLGMPPAAQFRHLEAPMLRAVLPGAVVTVFLICLSSFAIALTLGGGPRASTLELSIYQALRFEADLGRAALLALMQFALCALVTLAALRFARTEGFGMGLALHAATPAPGGWRRALDGVWIGAGAVFLIAPLLAIVVQGLPGLTDLPAGLWPALGRSVVVALVSAALALVAALALALGAARGGGPGGWLELSAMLPLAASALVLGTGLFILLRPLVGPEAIALPVTVLANALMALPFVFRLLLPDVRRLLAGQERLARSLGMTGPQRLRHVTLPALSRPIGTGAGLAAALSMGDLGVVTLFAGERGVTLPLLVQRLIGAYRIDEAAGAALVLVLASLGLFTLFDRWGSRRAEA